MQWRAQDRWQGVQEESCRKKQHMISMLSTHGDKDSGALKLREHNIK
jgi:hypothetical protein